MCKVLQQQNDELQIYIYKKYVQIYLCLIATMLEFNIPSYKNLINKVFIDSFKDKCYL